MVCSATFFIVLQYIEYDLCGRLPGPSTQTPLYDTLTTNLPHPIMSFKSLPFAPSTPLFPHASVVLAYLRAYADRGDLRKHIQFTSQVSDVKRVGSKWIVKVGQIDEEEFDFLIVANGHFRLPRYPEPDIPGLQAWIERGIATHAYRYRKPSSVVVASETTKILVIGGGPSGSDIVSDYLVAGYVVVHSVAGSASKNVGFRRNRGRVAGFLHDSKVLFEGGEVEENVDHCILATGYQFSFPFLSSIISPSPSSSDPTCHHPPLAPDSLPDQMYSSTYHLYPLAKHLFPLQTGFPPTSVAFMGLTLRGIPLSLFETQAKAIVKVISDPTSLNIVEEVETIRARYEQLTTAFGGDERAVMKNWHKLTEPESFEYRDELNRFAGSSERVEDWEKEMWEQKVLLRKVWKGLEVSGEAKAWVDGVGRRGGVEGKEDWVKVMRKLIRAGTGDSSDFDRYS